MLRQNSGRVMVKEMDCMEVVVSFRFMYIQDEEILNKLKEW